ncbi:hypothetical protein EVAR_99507_1 [Eumeta japonica]|uniref:Uncharacterized protein n=1 Tax=Eumeta variegata TaxID=151549 RepID=A0A4C1Z6U2_EUMVA|nr:hypothetical protein EVAR_99507_1 [Eumeta japonica]
MSNAILEYYRNYLEIVLMLVTERSNGPFLALLLSYRFRYVGYSIPSRKADNALVPLLELRVSMGGDDHLLCDDWPSHLPFDYVIKNTVFSGGRSYQPKSRLLNVEKKKFSQIKEKRIYADKETPSGTHSNKSSYMKPNPLSCILRVVTRVSWRSWTQVV